MLENLKAANLKRWNNMKINTSAVAGLDKVAKRLVASKARYQAVEAKTSVPWPVIAVIHEREASQSWIANLAQGDRWDRVSTHIPRGQGPFKSWEEAAINALKTDHLSTWGDWSAGGMLAALEKYNGLGYQSKGMPSPYVWSKSDQYKAGKYVSDGVFSRTAVDVQDGCAPLLKCMMGMDATIDKQYHWNTPGTVASAAPGVIAVGTVAAGATAIATTPPEHMHWAIIGTVTALVVGIVIWLVYEYRNTPEVTNVK